MKNKKISISHFGGINEHSDSLSEAVEMVNLSVTKDGNLRKRFGTRKILSLRGEKILASWEGTIRGSECILFVTSGGFYQYLSGAEAAIFLRPFFGNRAFLFEFDEKVYILSDVDLYSFDGGVVERVEGYSPVIAIGTDQDGVCELFEAVNMLTPRRRQRFSTDGVSMVLRLLEKDVERIISVKHFGEAIDPSNYVFDKTNSTITLNEPYPKGENTIEVEYEAKSNDRAKILTYERASVFGGGNDTRVFLYGSSDKPSYRRHSEIGGGISRGDYFPENNFTSLSGKVITSIIRHYDRQLIFCLDSAFYSTDELRQDSLGNYFHSFPIYSLNSEKGHVGSNAAILINNEPISITYDGIYRWVSTSVRDERNAIKLSSKVDGKVLRFLKRRDEFPIRLFDDDINEELWVVSGDEALIYNYGLGIWYFYEGLDFVSFSRCFDILLLGNEEGDVFVFEDTSEVLPILYVSGKSFLGDGSSQKDICSFVIDAFSRDGGSFDIELFDAPKCFDSKMRLTLLGSKKTESFRHRLVFRRIRQLYFSLEGEVKDAIISGITFNFRERGRLL